MTQLEVTPYDIVDTVDGVSDELEEKKKMSKLEEVTPCDDADVVDSVGDEHDDKKKTKKNDADGVDDENENEEDNEEDEDDEDMTKNGDTSFARLANQLVAMIKQAEEAVEAPVRGRELKPRQLSNASQTSQFDFDSLMNDLDNYLEEGEENVGGDANQVSLTKKNAEEPVNDVKKEKKGHSKQKSRQEEEFSKSLDSLTNSFNTILAEIEHEVNDDHLIMKENGEIVSSKMLASQYMDTQTLINHPSEDLADLDDFAQQCRLLTRAIILPFLHATHSFMSESLQTTKTSHTPRSVTSTTRSFMNLMYWTFLFTLGTLVLDAWLCEVAGQQVIRMVDMLKPGQTFTSSNDKSSNIIEHHDVNAIESDPQDGGMKMVEDCKKKNVKICTCLKMKAVTYLINNNDNFYNNGDCNYDEKQDIFSQSPISMNDSNYFINNRNNDNKRNSISSSGINYYNSSNDNNNIIIDQRRQSSYDILYDHEMEEYEEGEDIDLNIPGSFPSAFKWSPQSSYLIDNNIINKKDNVRRVKSVVLRRPKRIGSLSGSGGYWVVRSRKVRTRHNNNNNTNNNKIIPKRNSSSKFNSISKNKKMFSSTTSLPERIWIRRNSI